MTEEYKLCWIDLFQLYLTDTYSELVKSKTSVFMHNNMCVITYNQKGVKSIFWFDFQIMKITCV